MYIYSFKELVVWQRAMELVCEIYNATQFLPPEERFGLTSQMRRAVVSVPSNIAEGRKRKTRNDFLQFLRIANGSAAELETQVYIVERLYKNIALTRSKSLLEEVQKMLATMIKKLEISNS